MRLNLFNKHISEIRFDDIKSLKDKNIKEGWFVEYKSENIKPQKLGKSVSSFANQEGGWIFIGVEAGKDNCPSGNYGHKIQQDNILDWIRNSIVGNISPVPVFEVASLFTDNNEEIIVIKVPRGDDAPYICSDGRIYSRNDCGSDPIKDKYILNELHKRKEVVRKFVEHYTEEEYSQSQGQREQENPCLELQLFPENFSQSQIPNFNTEKELAVIKEIFNSPTEIAPGFNATIGIDFDKVFFSYNSIILTTTKMNPPSLLNLGLTVEIRADGTLKAYIPINSSYLTNLYNKPFYIKDKSIDQIVGVVGHENANYFRLLDGFNLFFVNMKIVEAYKNYINTRLKPNNVSLRIKLSNVWRSMIFFESSKFHEILSRHNLPFNLKDEIQLPHFVGGNRLFYKWEHFSNFTTFYRLVEALGLPSDASGELVKSINDYLAESDNINKKIQELNNEL